MGALNFRRDFSLASPVILAPTKGVGGWQSTLADFRAYLATVSDNPHSRPAMSSPPTITVLTSTPAGYDQIYEWLSNKALFSYYGGAEKVYATDYRRFPNAKIAATGGNCNDGDEATVWRTGTVVNADRVCFVLNHGAQGPVRFLVNGQYASFSATSSGATGIIRYVLTGLTPGQFVEIEAEKSASFRQVRVPTGNSIAARVVSRQWRGIVFGDSITAGEGATPLGDGYSPIAGDYLGMADWFSSGVGATGYLATFGGTRYSLPQRIVEDLDRALLAGPLDIVVIAMGINDIGVAGDLAAAVNTVFDTVRQKCANALVFVIGPWDRQAPSAPDAGYSTVKTAIQAAVAGRGGFYFRDPEGVSYTKVDATHPDNPGHTTLGLWANDNVREAVDGA